MSIAIAQQQQEEATNQHRQQGVDFKVRDKVQLNLENIQTDQLSKKLDQKHTKFTVQEKIGLYSFRLDTPNRIYNVFHSKLLQLTATDPLESQRTDDEQPPPVILGDHEEYIVEEIL